MLATFALMPFFFFQAEDGIRDGTVTGVQTCALPISLPYHAGLEPQVRARNQAAFVASEEMVMVATVAFGMGIDKPDVRFVAHVGIPRSEERRVGKECRSRWPP